MQRIILLSLLLAGSAQAGLWKCTLAILNALPEDEGDLIPYHLYGGTLLASPPKNFVSAFPEGHRVTTISQALHLGPRDYTYFTPKQWEQFQLDVQAHKPLSFKDTPVPRPADWGPPLHRLELQRAKDRRQIQVPTWYVENLLNGRADDPSLFQIYYLKLQLEQLKVPYGTDIRNLAWLTSLKMNEKAKRTADWHFKKYGSIRFSAVQSTPGGVLQDYAERSTELHKAVGLSRNGAYDAPENRVTIDVTGALGSGPYQPWWYPSMQDEIVVQVSRAAVAQSGPKTLQFWLKAKEMFGPPRPHVTSQKDLEGLQKILVISLTQFFIDRINSLSPYFTPDEVNRDFEEMYEFLFTAMRSGPMLTLALEKALGPTMGKPKDLTGFRKALETCLRDDVQELDGWEAYHTILILNADENLRMKLDEVLGLESAGKEHPKADHLYPIPQLKKAVLAILFQRGKYFLAPQLYDEFRQAIRTE